MLIHTKEDTEYDHFGENIDWMITITGCWDIWYNNKGMRKLTVITLNDT